MSRNVIGTSKRGVHIPQDATLAQAITACRKHFLIVATPATWGDLHSIAKAAGYVLVPTARERGAK